MATTKPAYPIINNFAPDYSSIECSLDEAGLFKGITELSYSDNVDRGEARGTGPQVLAYTRGQYKAEASFTMLKQDADNWLASLGNGFMEKSFDMTINYRVMAGDDVNTDVIKGCKIASKENSHSSGTDALVVAFTLTVMSISTNGLDPLEGMLK